MMSRSILLAVSAQPLFAEATETSHAANPIRKVVNLLQNMQKKVEAEGEKAEELYKQFMCYCSTSGGDLQASIDAATAKIPQLAAAIEAASSRKEQLQADLKSHQTDRRAAEAAMKEATAIREKEKATFDQENADMNANLAATLKATAAIEKGMGSSFLQTSTAALLRKVVNAREMLESDKQEVLSFLSGSSEYAPASGEIVGILKQMGETMDADEKDMVAKEEAAVKDYTGLMHAKKKEVASLSKMIETKIARVGEVGVEIATMEADADDTAEALSDDKKFIKDLKTNCAEKEGLHEEEKKVRAQEIVALADTIKILSDDDALEIFKKTLPGASSSFLQVQRTAETMRSEARAILTSARAKATSDRHNLDFVLLALRGRKGGFGKIIQLVDKMVVTLKKEQGDDDDKKEYCEKSLDQAEDKKKGLEHTEGDLEKTIADTEEGISTLTQELTALKAGIVALDKQVEEGTIQRKAEAAEHKELMQTDSTAKELLLFAKNRLNKFYNPAQYKPAPKRELSEGDQIYVNQGGDIPTEAPGGIANTGIGFLQVSSDEAPAPPPATAAAYRKKGEESNGVIAMVDLLVQDLDKEMQVAETEEAAAQKEYEELLADSSDKRRQDSKSVTDKEGAKADLEGVLVKSRGEHKATLKALMGVDKYLGDLHGECDWLLKYFDVRKEARTNEIAALKQAKDVLNGADSL